MSLMAMTYVVMAMTYVVSLLLLLFLKMRNVYLILYICVEGQEFLLFCSVILSFT